MTTVHPTTDMHPEVPMPAWANERNLTDAAEDILVDRQEWRAGEYLIEREVVHFRQSVDGEWQSSPQSISVSYDLVWPDGTGIDREQFVVMPGAIPTLIEALQAAYEEVNK